MTSKPSDGSLIWEGDYVRGTWIAFQRTGSSDSGKTMVWEVFNYDEAGFPIGHVRWFARWRQYALFADVPGIVFEKTCLKEISQFLTDLMSQREEQKRA